MSFVQSPLTPRICNNFINNQWGSTSEKELLPVLSPYTGELIGQLANSSEADVAAAVEAAQSAFGQWSKTPIKERSRPLLKFHHLVTSRIDELANTAALECGKTVAEARAGIEKGLEVVEFALSLQNLDTGGTLEVSRGVTCETRREGLGVVAGIVPFNFPAMVPMWMFPIAITLGNCFVMKPSEKVPLTMNDLAELMAEAGYPPGVFNLVNGSAATATALVDHPLVQAVAFVGSTQVAKAVYHRATGNGKRCLALGGAKNILIVTPDADLDITVKGVVDSFTGCAGQRCMAASLMITVGDCEEVIRRVRARASELVVGRDMGALIDAAAVERIRRVVKDAELAGAKVILNGTEALPPVGYEKGQWQAPTIIDHATADMECSTFEIFGPVLTIIRCKTLQEALDLEAQATYGNATSVFTSSGAVAQYVSSRATSGMIGINIGVPVPREPFSFGGTKASKFGHGDITGLPSLDFWSNLKKITSKWALEKDMNWMS